MYRVKDAKREKRGYRVSRGFGFREKKMKAFADGVISSLNYFRNSEMERFQKFCIDFPWTP